MNKLKELFKRLLQALFVDLKKWAVNKLIDFLQAIIDKLRAWGE